MINTQLQDLSYMIPKLPETEGSFLTGLAKGFTKGAMRKMDAAKPGENPDDGPEDGEPRMVETNGEERPRPPEPENETGPLGKIAGFIPGLLEKVGGFFTDPMAMQEYRQQSAKTKEVEQKASLGEVLQRDLSGVLQQFRDTKTTEDRWKLIKDNSGLSIDPNGNRLLAMMTETTGNLDRAERMSEMGLQKAAMQNELKELVQWGYVPGMPASAVQARKNRFMVNHIQPVMDKYNPFEVTTEMWDETGNPKLEMIYSAMGKAGIRRPTVTPSEAERAIASAPPEEQPGLLANWRKKVTSPTKSTMQVYDRDGNPIMTQSTGDDLPPALGRAAQEKVDSSIETISAANQIEKIVDTTPEAFGLVGAGMSGFETAKGLFNPKAEQEVNKARTEVETLIPKLIQLLRGDTGKMDVSEQERLMSLLNFNKWTSTPGLIKNQLKLIREISAMSAIRQWQRAPASAQNPLPQSMVEVIESPIPAAMLISGGLAPEALKGRVNIKVGEADASHIEQLFRAGIIDQTKADDLVIHNKLKETRSDVDIGAIKRLMDAKVFSPAGYQRYKAIAQEMMKKQQ